LTVFGEPEDYVDRASDGAKLIASVSFDGD
jgi:hypothetical protein